MHLNLDDEEHCKIRFRRSLDEPEQNNYFIKILIEIFLLLRLLCLFFQEFL